MVGRTRPRRTSGQRQDDANDGGSDRERRSARRAAARIAPLVAAVVVSWCAWSASAGAGGSTVVAQWEMDEAPGATALVDSGPWGIDGSVGSSVQTGVHAQGTIGHRRQFADPDSSPVDSERLGLIDHDDRLNPGNGDFAVTIRLRTTSPQGNIVQKGQATVPGGYFKVDMDQGRVACVFVGDRTGVHLGSSQPIADGTWHEVRCVRTDSDVTLVIDGSVIAHRSVTLGPTANTWPLAIAGKVSCNQVKVGCDYFSGDLDRVQLDRSASITAPGAATTTVQSTEPTISVTTTSPPSTTAAPPTTTRVPSTTKPTPTTTTTTMAPVVK